MTEEKHYPLSFEQLTNLCKLAGGKISIDGYSYERCVLPGPIGLQEPIGPYLKYNINHIIEARNSIKREESFIHKVKERFKEETEGFKERIKKDKKIVKENEIKMYSSANFSRVYGSKKEEREKGEKVVKIIKGF